jgi:hypothetical protein
MHELSGTQQFREMANKTDKVVVLSDFIPVGVLKPTAVGLAHAQSDMLINFARVQMQNAERQGAKDTVGQMMFYAATLVCADEVGHVLMDDNDMAHFLFVNEAPLARLMCVASTLSIPKLAEAILQE